MVLVGLLVLTLGACGVKQEDYDAVVQENEALKSDKDGTDFRA